MQSLHSWQSLYATRLRCHGQIILTTGIASQSRWASLSAIHRGRRSEQSRGTRNTALERAPVPLNRSERSRARAAAQTQTFKIKKGKKDITQKAVPDPLTRQARFYNPNFSHGKKSLVYKAKTGKLQEELSALREEERRLSGKSGSTAVSKDAFNDAFKSERSSPWERPNNRERKDLPWKTESRGRRDSGSSAPGGMRGDRERGSFREERPRRTDRSAERESPFGAGSDRPRGGLREQSSGRTSRPIERASFSREGDGRARGGFREQMDSRTTRPAERAAPFGERDGRARGGFREQSDSRENRRTDRASSFEKSSEQSSDGFKDPAKSREGRHTNRNEREWSTEQHKAYHAAREQTYPREAVQKPRSGEDMQQPVSIEYTTAASQFLYGKSVVEAALKTSARKLYKLYVYAGANRENTDVDEAMVALARKKGIPVRTMREGGTRLMDKMAGGRPHNGYILEASPMPQKPLASLGPFTDAEHPGFKVELAHQSAEEAEINGKDDFIRTVPGSHKPLVVVLDQILDPQNLGAVLRSVNFLGATAVAITKRNSASLTPVALKASAGASEALTLFSIEHLAPFLAESKESGWKVYAAVPLSSSGGKHKQMSIHDVEEQDPLSKDPCILLLGGEGEGLSKQLKSKADFEVNIPNMSQTNLVDSLNVSVAAGLLCSSFLKGKAKAELEVLNKKRETLSLF